MRLALDPRKLLTLLALLVLTLPTSLSAQEVEYNWTNAEDNNAWSDPGNWGIDDGTTPGGPEAVVNISGGLGFPVYGSAGSGGGGSVLTLNIGNGAGLDINGGFIGFSQRTANRPFAMQNSGSLNVTGSTAQIRLRDQAANFSTGSINLHNGGSINLTDGNAILNTSNLDNGNGVINLSNGSGEAQAKITGANGAILAFEKQTIQGFGLVGNNSIGLSFDSDSIVDANMGGQSLIVQGNSAFGAVNHGIMQATNGGVLDIRSKVDNATGLIESTAGSAVQLGNGFDITGGTLRQTGVGVFTATGSGNLTNLTLENLALKVNDNRNLGLNGTIINQGDIEANSTGQFTDIQIDSATILTGGRSVTLSGAGFARITDDNGGGALTNVDNTIQGLGRVGNGLVQINNQVGGTIDANASAGSLDLSPVAGASMVNRGLMTATAGGNLRFRSGNYDNANGLIEVGDNSTITLNNGSIITGGTVRDNGTGNFVMGSTGTLESLTIQGQMNVRDNSNLALIGNIDNQGNIELNSTGQFTDLQIDNAASLAGGGTVTLSGVGFARITDDNGGGVLTNVDNTIRGRGLVGNNQIQFINQADGTLHANESGQRLTVDTSDDMLVNMGKLFASNGGILDVLGTTNNSGIIDAEMGSTAEFDTLVNEIGGQLVGDGTIEALNEIVNNGTASPGNSPGMLTLDADLTLGATSELEIELQDLNLFDLLNVNGDVQLDGDLTLALLSGFDADETAVFDIITADSIMGSFANVFDGQRLLSVDGGGSFQVNYNTGSVQLSNFAASSVPEPGSATLILMAGVALLTRRRQRSA